MSIESHEDLHRRHVLCGGGAFVFAAMIASLLGGSKPVRAQTITGGVPEVDRVSVRVVIDSYQFAVAAGKQMGSVDVQHFGWGPEWRQATRQDSNQRVRPIDACRVQAES